MGIDISHIVKHDYKNVKNHASTMDFVKETINRLKQILQINGVNEISEEEDFETISFELPIMLQYFE
jgi:hypothetical protein